MLFFKQKPKIDELLPPPPPSLDLDLEQEIKEKPKFFDEIIKPKKAEPIPEEEEFSDLVKEFGGLKPKKTLRKSVKAASKKILKAKSKKKIPANAQKQLKKVEIKKLKDRAKPKKIVRIKPVKKLKLRKIKKTEQKKPQAMPDNFGLRGIDFELPKDLEEPKEEIKLPETLEDFDMDELGEDLQQKANSKEISEAQEEIQSAIDKIKKKERLSFFGRLFERMEIKKQEESYPIFSISNGDGLSIIQSGIKKARGALMRFDLEAARRYYIEIMRLYNNLSPQDKAKVYNDINEIYYERKNAEELKI